MDIVRNIFKSPVNLTINKDSPLGAIEEQIKQLENLNLSPLPSSKEAVVMHKNDVSAILKKIIYNFDIILMDKLKKGSSMSDELHYWSYLSKYFQIPSVKFIHNIYDKLQTNSEKGLSWIYISISEKSFHESLREIYNQGFERKFYEAEALISKHKAEIIFLSEKVSKFQFFNIKLGIEEEYQDYKKMKESEGKENDRYEIDLPMVSPITKQRQSQNLYITPYTLDLKESKSNMNNNMYYSKATLDFSNSNLHSRVDGQEKGIKTIDNLFNIINTEDEEHMLNPGDDDEIESPRERNNPKNTHIIYNNISTHSNTQVNYNNYNNDEKVLSALKQMAKQQNNNENFNICKYIDIQSCYRENFFSFVFDNQSEKGNYKEKVYAASKFQNQTEGKTSSNNNNNNNNNNNSKKDIDFNIDNINNSNNNYIPFDKNFRICRKVDKNQFTKKDIIYYNNKDIKMTNSVVFYLNHYYKKEPYIRFNTQITTERPVTIASQNYQCQFCRKKFKTLMHIPLSKVYWCSYYMRFICEECACDEYSVIPSFILKFWNFKKFPISKAAKDLLTQWYDKPVIHIKQKDPVIKESSLLHTAILMKRKIHKIFDLMKCDNSEAFVFNTLGSYKHFVLRENLFSLKDLVDIYEYRLINKLKEFLQKFENHLLKDCNTCNYKGGTCVMCMTDEILYAYDVETVLYCNECKKLFHKKCCSFHPCIINR